MIKNLRINCFIIVCIFLLPLLTSCNWFGEKDQHYDRVMILYSAGFTDISSYLIEDINDLKNGYIPARKGDDVLLVISKQPSKSGNYSIKTSPSLTRIRKGKKSDSPIECDTLMTMSSDTKMADANTLRQFLEYVQSEFPAQSYGMIVSSHGSGWLPEGYFNNPSHFEQSQQSGTSAKRFSGKHHGLVPYIEPERDPSLPDVKSVTHEFEYINGDLYQHEINIEDFANAIPMHMDYIMFDTCFMGGIEVAYALKKVTDFVSFSQTEVLADGYDYTSISESLLAKSSIDIMEVCSNFFQYYDTQSGSWRSATISYIDLREIDNLASLCKELFETYHDGIMNIDASKVQCYYYKENKRWFYDLYDIIKKAGASENDLGRLQSALDECVIYKASTPYFMNILKINCHSGFSMYLPPCGSDYLDNFYKTLSWNKATNLVR